MAKSSSPRPPGTRKPRAPKAAVVASASTPKSVAKIVSIAPAPLDPAPLDPAPLDPAMIAVRAYELFLESGAVHGHDVEHWLRAERELLAARLTSAA